MTVKRILLTLVWIFVSACNNDKALEDTSDHIIKEQKNTVKNIMVEDKTKLNPFLQPYTTEFQLAPFNKIKDKHFLPAFEQAIKESKKELLLIANNTEQASFDNTIAALEYSGQLLNKVSNVFFNLTSSNTNDKLKKIAKNISPRLTNLKDDIYLNIKLFERVSELYNKIETLNLRSDEKKLLEDYYKEFIRGGAALNQQDKQKLREFNETLSKLSLEFADNVLAETNDFELVIDNKDDLAGLPDYLIEQGAKEAAARNYKDQWVFTTHRPSKTPFLMYSKKRHLREKMWKAYTNRGDNNNANDNKMIVAKMASLRVQKAKLLGYQSYAHLVLENNTAKSPENAYKLLNKIWPASLKQAKKELSLLQQIVNKEAKPYEVKAWDWRYLSERIRKEKYNITEEETKPYFSFQDTLKGVFYTVNKLYGMTFKERNDLAMYHKDVRAFEVYYKNGELIGLYLIDPYVRESKRGGAWMNGFRNQSISKDGTFIKPIIVNVLNFPLPNKEQVTLLTFDQAKTLFHEFGHSVHGFLSNVTYPSQTGTSVPRDFVEFPSQVLENWMFEPSVLKYFARHYKTGKTIPQSLINKIQKAAQFGQGFATTEYMAATLLDLAWHTETDPTIKNTEQFEKSFLKEIGLINQIAPRYRSTYFSHIFQGGYSAGYYGYIWSEILAADAFNVFKQKGLFDQATANSFRENILSKGGTEEAMSMYLKFRGQQPDVKYLLNSRGLLTK